MRICAIVLWLVYGRTPQGVRGLKFPIAVCIAMFWSRTPQGVRGLKLSIYHTIDREEESHPARGAWIEIGLTTSR